MEFLTFAQTVFYLTVSLAIIVIGILCAVVVFHLIHIVKHLRNISDNLDDATGELKNRVKEVIEQLASLPILSYFLKRSGTRATGQARKKRS